MAATTCIDVLPPICEKHIREEGWKTFLRKDNVYGSRKLLAEYLPQKLPDFDMLLSNLKQTVLDSDNLTFVHFTMFVPETTISAECIILMKIGIESFCLTWRVESNAEGGDTPYRVKHYYKIYV